MPGLAHNVMSRRVVSAKPDDTIAEVARLMADHNVSAVPVCDDDGTLRGMISEGDLLRPFGQAQGLQRSWWPGVLAGGDQLVQALARYLQLEQRRVRDLMTAAVISVTWDANLAQIIDLLLHYRIKRVPVVRDGKFVGIVSRADLIRVMTQQPRALQEFQHARLRGSNAPLG